MFYKDGSIKGALNETEAPFNGMKIMTLDDGSTWGRIYWLDIYKQNTCFSNATEANKCIHKTNRYSVMKYLNKFGQSQVEITNLAPVINGATGFSTGAAFSDGEGTHKYSGASFQLTGTTAAEVTAQSNATIPLVNGHTYYARMEVKQPTVHGSAEMFLGGSSVGGSVAAPPIITSKAVSAANTWTSMSGIAVRNFPTGNHRLRLDYNNSGTSGYTMRFDGLVIVDLTECFGAGKEPSQAWCDANIPYFNGTIKIDSSNSNYRKWEFLLAYPLLNNVMTELEYIQATGTQYIDTGYKPTSNNLKFHLDFKQDASIGSQSLFGAESNSGTRQWPIVPHGGNGKYAHYLGNTSGYMSTAIPVGPIHDYTLHVNNGALTIDLDGVRTTGSYSGELLKTYNIFLFANNIDGTAGQFAQNKVYRFQIWDNDILVRDMIPCKKADGTVGMFDKIGKTFYGNSGSGSFTAGTAKGLFTHIPHNRWSQINIPNGTDAPLGYKRIHTSWINHAGPLRTYSTADRVWDCDNGNNSNWFNPIGQLKLWSTGNSIPGADGNPQYEIELWVRLDNLNPATKTQIYNEEMLARQFYEL